VLSTLSGKQKRNGVWIGVSTPSPSQYGSLWTEGHRLTVNLLLNNITFFMIFAVFDVSLIACRR